MRLFIFAALISLFLCADGATAAKKIVFVVATDPLSEADELIEKHLVKYGFQLEIHTQDEAQPVNIDGADAVFISESCSSGNIVGAYTDAPIPVITTEFYIIDEMGFAVDGTFDNTARRIIVIADPDHPVAGGLEGEIEVTSEPTDNEEIQSASAMQGDVQIIATLPNGNASIMCYEKDAKSMGDAVVPARRIFVFPHSRAILVLTDDGWGLLERAVLWALGMSTLDVDPSATLANTWGSIKIH